MWVCSELPTALVASGRTWRLCAGIVGRHSKDSWRESDELGLAALFLLLATLCWPAPAHAQTNEWTWMAGGQVQGQPGVYGNLQAPAAGNVPGSRQGGVTWTDPNGNLWLFGGYGYDSSGTAGYLNDLWEFKPSTNQWTWIGGSSKVPQAQGGQAGVYGTLGAPAAANVPGARSGAAGWADKTGNLWLYGGDGFDASGTQGTLNDLWEFNPSTGEWTWMGGNSLVPGLYEGQPGVYGTIGQPATGNLPGDRTGAAAWIDKSGNFWLFGGDGEDSTHNSGVFNDLWE